MSRSLHLAVATLAGLLLLPACGDDSDTAARTDHRGRASRCRRDRGGDTDAAADTDPYCALVAEINSAGFPTADQVRKYQELAPDEIQDQVGIAGPAIIEADEAGNGEAAMSDPAVASAVEKITAFEGETCGPAGQGGDAAATGDGRSPSSADWCDGDVRCQHGAGTDRGASRRRGEGRSQRDQRRRRIVAAAFRTESRREIPDWATCVSRTSASSSSTRSTPSTAASHRTPVTSRIPRSRHPIRTRLRCARHCDRVRLRIRSACCRSHDVHHDQQGQARSRHDDRAGHAWAHRRGGPRQVRQWRRRCRLRVVRGSAR